MSQDFPWDPCPACGRHMLWVGDTILSCMGCFNRFTLRDGILYQRRLFRRPRQVGVRPSVEMRNYRERVADGVREAYEELERVLEKEAGE